MTSELAQDLNLPVDHGALVQERDARQPGRQGRPARGQDPDRAGRRAAGGDLIVEVDGKEMRSEDAVATAITDNKPGDSVEITFYRGNDKQDRDGRARQAARQRRHVRRQGGQGGGGGRQCSALALCDHRRAMTRVQDLRTSRRREDAQLARRARRLGARA